MKRGVPPTALKARTGEFTPPGVTARARSNSAPEAAVGAVEGAAVTRAIVAERRLTRPRRQVRRAVPDPTSARPRHESRLRARNSLVTRHAFEPGTGVEGARPLGARAASGEQMTAMSAQSEARAEKAAALVPLALLSAALDREPVAVAASSPPRSPTTTATPARRHRGADRGHRGPGQRLRAGDRPRRAGLATAQRDRHRLDQRHPVRRAGGLPARRDRHQRRRRRPATSPGS